MRMNMGMVVRTYSEQVMYGAIPTVLVTVFQLPVMSNNPSVPAPARPKAIGTPNRSRPIRTKKGNPISNGYFLSSLFPIHFLSMESFHHPCLSTRRHVIGDLTFSEIFYSIFGRNISNNSCTISRIKRIPPIGTGIMRINKGVRV